jgi:hypothetical protein
LEAVLKLLMIGQQHLVVLDVDAALLDLAVPVLLLPVALALALLLAAVALVLALVLPLLGPPPESEELLPEETLALALLPVLLLEPEESRKEALAMELPLVPEESLLALALLPLAPLLA